MSSFYRPPVLTSSPPALFTQARCRLAFCKCFFSILSVLTTTLVTCPTAFETRGELANVVDDCLSESSGGDCSTKYGPIAEWDVSRVSDMSGMFKDASSFNGDISQWNVSQVTDMNRMFWHANSFSHTLCGEAWVNSKTDFKVDKTDMFYGSSGSISRTICGLWSIVIILILFSIFSSRFIVILTSYHV